MTRAPATLRRITLAPDARGGWRMVREMGPDPAQALVGRTPGEGARLAPLIFNLCGAAHGRAAVRALGLPEGLDAATPERMARETVRDHALAILQSWPAALGQAPDRAALALLARPGGEAACAAALAGAGCDPAGFSVGEMEAWLKDGPTGTARLLARIRRAVDPAEGRASLPELTAADVAAALGEEDAAAPLRETGALGRVGCTPLLSALLAAEGRSLFVRLLARLLDCLAALRAEPQDAFDLPFGIGLAPAARGLLGHGARIEAGRIAAYRILSPSAWNLAPGGLLERAVAALPAGPRARWLAPLIVGAVNPCVPVTLAFDTEAAHA